MFRTIIKVLFNLMPSIYAGVQLVFTRTYLIDRYILLNININYKFQ